MADITPATVALIAHGIMERKVRFGVLDAQDFTGYMVPGSSMTYVERTMRDACTEAWEIVALASKTDPRNKARMGTAADGGTSGRV